MGIIEETYILSRPHVQIFSSMPIGVFSLLFFRLLDSIFHVAVLFFILSAIYIASLFGFAYVLYHTNLFMRLIGMKYFNYTYTFGMFYFIICLTYTASWPYLRDSKVISALVQAVSIGLAALMGYFAYCLAGFLGRKLVYINVILYFIISPLAGYVISTCLLEDLCRGHSLASRESHKATFLQFIVRKIVVCGSTKIKIREILRELREFILAFLIFLEYLRLRGHLKGIVDSVDMDYVVLDPEFVGQIKLLHNLTLMVRYNE